MRIQRAHFFVIAAQLLLLVLALYVLTVNPAHAWSSKGHAVIAQSALEQLPPLQRQFFNRHASALLNNDQAKKWRHSLNGFSPFAMAAVWPDTRRDVTLNTLFNRYGQSAVLPALKYHAPFKTANWHYVNQQYWYLPGQRLVAVGLANQPCAPKTNGYLAKVWPQLLLAYQQASTSAQRGLLVAFMSHLLADAYQPLHGLAALNNQCKHDAGGNGHCLVFRKNGRCQLNLHRLWDGGFDVFNASTAFSVPKPATVFYRLQDAEQAMPNALKNHGALAPFIYSAAQGQAPSKQYRQQAKNSVYANAQSAVAELAALLSYLYRVANQ